MSTTEHRANIGAPSKTEPTQTHAAPASASRALKLLQKISYGQLELTTPDGQVLTFGRDTNVIAVLEIHDWRVLSEVMQSGDIAFAEGYIDKRWSTSNLTDLLHLFVVNRDQLNAVIYGSWWGSLLYRIKHFLNRNSKSGSAKNIHAHYDLGNDFYQLWLDETMNYSSASFEGDLHGDLSAAQNAKVRRALLPLDLKENQRLLEIGCGWGALAEIASDEFGVQVLGITLSQEQLSFAQNRLLNQGLNGEAQLRLQDYRDLPAQYENKPFDAIASIEMFEAVGMAYWDSYFNVLHGCLKVGGKACVQSISIRDDLFEQYKNSSDFIQQYVFPGGMLPSKAIFEKLAMKHGFKVVSRFSFGKDYAETLRRWRVRFLEQEQQVLALGFDARFIRLWSFYLTYCEIAFDSGNTDVSQWVLQRLEV